MQVSLLITLVRLFVSVTESGNMKQVTRGLWGRLLSACKPFYGELIKHSKYDTEGRGLAANAPKTLFSTVVIILSSTSII